MRRGILWQRFRIQFLTKHFHPVTSRRLEAGQDLLCLLSRKICIQLPNFVHSCFGFSGAVKNITLHFDLCKNMYIHVHDGHKVSIVEHRSNYSSEGVKNEMLSLVELSARELGMLKLMADFFAEKPELTAKIESYTTAHYALATTYSENFGISTEDAWKIFEDLQKKINESEYLQVKAPAPLRALRPLPREELNMLRVLVDYFSENPKMAPAGAFLSTRVEALAGAYQWFYGNDSEVAR